MEILLRVIEFVGKHKTWVVAIAGFVAGLFVGMFLYAQFWPIPFVNATPVQLRLDFRNDYFVWVAERYERTGDLEWARTKLMGADYFVNQAEVERALDEVAQGRSGEDVFRLSLLKQALQANPVTPPPSVSQPETPTQGGFLKSLGLVCLAALLVIVLVGGGIYVLSRLRAQAAGPRRVSGVGERPTPAQAASWGAEGPPLAQFPTTYSLGDDHYDPSFSIEMENGEFMGECGVGISETIGVGSPDKVTAFEVWLFDKSDIRTVTKVLMSEYAYNDEALRAKLAPKGEPVLARPGQEVELETKTLRVRARVVEALYGTGNLPPNSFFERMTIELAAWGKPAATGARSLESDITLPAPNY